MARQPKQFSLFSRHTLIVLIVLTALLVPGWVIKQQLTRVVARSSVSITLSSTYGPPTSPVHVTGRGFLGRESVLLVFDTTPIGTTTASKTGSFSASLTIPTSALPGNHVVQARGKSSSLAAQTAFLVQTDWVQQGFNREHTSYNPFENVLNATNVSQLTLSWSYYEPGNYDAGGIAVSHGVVYFGCNNRPALCALSATTGQMLWSYSTDGPFYGPPAIANNLVYIAIPAPGGPLDAINAITGRLVWSYTTGYSSLGAPLTANGEVYVGDSSRTLSALNSTTGKLVWKRTFNFTSGTLATPSIDGSLLYVSAGSSVYALNPQTGQIVWQVSAIVGGTPVIANGAVYLSDTVNHEVLALSEYTGSILWRKAIPVTYDPAVASGIVYVTANCDLEAFSATTGTLVWQYGTMSTDCFEGVPSIANGVVYAGGTTESPGYMFSAATGALVALTQVNDTYLNISPVIVNGTLYYLTDGGVSAYHLS